MTQTPAGWYPDPESSDQQRYWDGTQWTEHRTPVQPTSQPPSYPDPAAAYQSPYQQPGQQQPGYGQQGYPSAASGAYQAPAKSHTTRNVLIVIGVLFLLLVGGCFAVVAVVAKGVDDAVDEVTANDKVPGGAKNPLTITPGEGFDVYGFKYADGWTVGADDLGLVDVENLKLTNTRKDRDSAFVDIKFLQGTEVVASVDCSSDSITPGTTVTLTCFSGDDLPDTYDTITINDSF